MNSETLITVLIAAVLVGSTLIPYIVWVRNKEKKAKKHFEESSIAGLQAATTVHPHIDALKCIGCGGCAQVCPKQAIEVVR